MEELKMLESMGITLPSPLYIAGAILFGIVGMFAYYYGKRTSRTTVKWIGVALMLYPYVISETWMMFAVGCGLCVALYYYRE